MFDTEQYTLVPYEYHSTGKERQTLSVLYDLDSSSEILSEDVPHCGAAFIYSRPVGMSDQKPASLMMLYKLRELAVLHRVIVRFSDQLVSVAIADREHLLLLCSYHVDSFNDALYHIFAALREVFFEPDHTCLHYSGIVSDDEKSMLGRYFEQVVEVNIDF